MHSIAIIDDDKETLNTLENFLTRENKYKVSVYSNPLSALSSFKNYAVDIILLDIIMPEMDGVKFLEQLRENNIDSTVIMVTASASLERIFKTHKLQAYDFIEKPVNLNELKTKIEKALS